MRRKIIPKWYAKYVREATMGWELKTIRDFLKDQKLIAVSYDNEWGFCVIKGTYSETKMKS